MQLSKELCVLLVLLAGVAVAQRPVPANVAKGDARIQEADLRRDLTYIASDQLQGRMSLEPGDETAVRWIAEQFRAAGLKPAAKDAHEQPSFLQEVPLIQYRADRAESAVTLRRGGKTAAWKAPDATGTFRHAVDLTAGVVFAGYGITAPE
ncbi:MAG TPA: hypothetical protein VN151_01825, partial [Terracidiphilus sp.]|nr:hypothetical protein [Terracidiphilus sp.]